MKRRDFIKSSLAASAGVALVGCSKEDTAPVSAYAGNVAIIGAGAAGLYAGFLLKQKNVKFTIYEASDRVGGRVRPLKSFSDFDVDLGAEEILGKRSAWYDIVKASPGTTFVGDTITDYLQAGGVLRAENLWASDTSYQAALKLIDGASTFTGTDISLQTYMNNNGLSGRFQPFVNAKIANEHGTSASRIGLKGLTEEEQLWSAGNEVSTVANRSLFAILEEKFKDIIPAVVLNTPIARIDYSNTSDQTVIIEDAKGQKTTYDKVIITVPLAILKAGDIKFTPDLPTEKKTALTRMGMDASMKIILDFKQPFWAPGTGSIYGQGNIPRYWVASTGRSKTANVLTAYVNGSGAETVAKQGTAIVNNILTDLDGMYGKGNASSVLKNAYIMDWAKETYIKGGVSYPLVGGGVAFRQDLSRSILKKLYFAGEATHYGGHSGTVHGAVETAQRAVNELLQDVA